MTSLFYQDLPTAFISSLYGPVTLACLLSLCCKSRCNRQTQPFCWLIPYTKRTQMEETKNKKRHIRKEKQNTEDKRRQATGTHQEEKQKKNQTRKHEDERETIQRSLRTKWASKSFPDRIVKLLKPEDSEARNSKWKSFLSKTSDLINSIFIF